MSTENTCHLAVGPYTFPLPIVVGDQLAGIASAGWSVLHKRGWKIRMMDDSHRVQVVRSVPPAEKWMGDFNDPSDPCALPVETLEMGRLAQRIPFGPSSWEDGEPDLAQKPWDRALAESAYRWALVHLRLRERIEKHFEKTEKELPCFIVLGTTPFVADPTSKLLFIGKRRHTVSRRSDEDFAVVCAANDVLSKGAE